MIGTVPRAGFAAARPAHRDQLWPDTATGRWLDRHAKIWGLARKPAQYAVGLVRLLGEDGSPIPAGMVLEQRVEGWLYEVLEAVEIEGGDALVGVVARAVGPTSDASAGTVLEFTTALPGVEGAVQVLVGELGEDGLVVGLDSELDDDLRARLLLRIADPPKSGSAADYGFGCLSSLA